MFSLSFYLETDQRRFAHTVVLELSDSSKLVLVKEGETVQRREQESITVDNAADGIVGEGGLPCQLNCITLKVLWQKAVLKRSQYLK